MTLDELVEKYGHVKLELDPHAVARMCSNITDQALEVARMYRARVAELEEHVESLLLMLEEDPEASDPSTDCYVTVALARQALHRAPDTSCPAPEEKR